MRRKESYGKAPPGYANLSLCVSDRKGIDEALRHAHVGQPSSYEIRASGVPIRLSNAKGNTEDGVIGKQSLDPAQLETLWTCGNSSHGKREIPWVPTNNTVGQPEKVYGHTSGAYTRRKLNGRIAPSKPVNRAKSVSTTKAVEERRLTEGNTVQAVASRT